MSVDRDPYDYSTRVFIKDIAQIFPVFRIFPSCIILKIDLYHAIGVFFKKYQPFHTRALQYLFRFYLFRQYFISSRDCDTLVGDRVCVLFFFIFKSVCKAPWLSMF